MPEWLRAPLYKAHKDSPDIRELIAVEGCPPQPKDLLNAPRRSGIAADAGLFDKMGELPGFFMSRYAGRQEFEEEHFRISIP